MANKQGSGRGFASMDPERQREIASQGGRAAHASGNAHEFTSQEARAAGARSHSGQQQNSQRQQQQQNNKQDQQQQQNSNRSQQGGTREQHSRAGSQSHKNQQR